jgi:predicted DNA-binding WGR domain protein
MTDQLEFFPEDIRIVRVDPEVNMHRFYRLRLLPDLFGGVSLLREWGRIGTPGRHKIELFPDAGKAADAMLRMYRAKQKRGYEMAV